MATKTAGGKSVSSESVRTPLPVRKSSSNDSLFVLPDHTSAFF